MCIYIKDDGEQCGMDSDEAFCHHHRGSRQARVYQAALTAAESDSSPQTMDATCTWCESSLRRRERLTAHPNMTRRVIFESVVRCDCSEVVIDTNSIRKADLPKHWTNEN